MEERDYYDESGNITGLTYHKGDDLLKEYYAMIVVIFIKNSKGQLLMQKRSLEKGGLWATTGGHPKKGETSLEGIIAEVYEELGMDISEDKIIKLDRRIGNNRICDFYYIEKDVDINELILQKEEVQEVKWFTKKEIDKLIENNEFHKTHAFMYLDYRNQI